LRAPARGCIILRVSVPRATRGLNGGWPLSFIAWTLIGAFFIGRNLVLYRTRGVPIAWDRGVLFELVYWYTWALLTPLVFRIARRASEPPRRARRAALRIVAWGVLVAPAQVALEAGISLLLARSLLGMTPDDMRRRIGLIVNALPLESFSGFATYCVVVAIYFALEYQRRFRERDLAAAELRRRLSEAELQALKMQLHPHFLFNTLQAISVLIKDDPDAAQRVLVRLGDLLRTVIDSARVREVPLRDELGFLDQYLDIQRVRFGQRLTLRRDIDQAALDLLVPPLLLQPLAENSVRHAIDPTLAGGTIDVTARVENGRLRLRLRDDGPGFPLGMPGPGGSGLGLSNTRARLEQLYGGSHRFLAANAPEGGAVVEIDLPARHAPPGP